MDRSIDAGSNYKHFLSGSIYNYMLEQHEKLPDDILNLHEEISLARHATKSFLLAYSKADHLLNIANDSPKADEKTRQAALDIAQVASDRLLSSLKKVSEIVKRAAEVDSIMLYRFNGMEVLSVLKQVENIMFDELSRISAPVELLGHGRGEQMIDSIVSHEQIAFKKDSLAEELISSIRRRIVEETQCVRINTQTGDSTSTGVDFALEREVNEMIGSVPDGQ